MPREGVQRMESIGGCSLCDLVAVRTFETVDDKTDEISYRFPIVNARKLSRSLSLLPSTSSFFSSLYGIFFRDRECTRVNEQLSDREKKKRKEKKKKKKYRVRLFYTLATLKQYFYFHSMILPSSLSLSLFSTFSLSTCRIFVQFHPRGESRPTDWLEMTWQIYIYIYSTTR